jgi:hypothetical protein
MRWGSLAIKEDHDVCAGATLALISIRCSRMGQASARWAAWPRRSLAQSRWRRIDRRSLPKVDSATVRKILPRVPRPSSNDRPDSAFSVYDRGWHLEAVVRHELEQICKVRSDLVLNECAVREEGFYPCVFGTEEREKVERRCRSGAVAEADDPAIRANVGDRLFQRRTTN